MIPKNQTVYLLPNIITTGNLLCGFFSLLSSMQERYIYAAWAILAGIIFDALDGRIARLARATSQFGVEYDSLSDVVTFGVAPAVLLYRYSLFDYGRIGIWIASAYLVSGALRLARFNTLAEEAPQGHFLGLPIPGAACFIASFFLFIDYLEIQALAAYVVPIFTLFLSILMISTIYFPSFKHMHWRSKASFAVALLGITSTLFIAYSPEIFIFISISGYILASLGLRVLYHMKKNASVS